MRVLEGLSACCSKDHHLDVRPRPSGFSLEAGVNSQLGIVKFFDLGQLPLGAVEDEQKVLHGATLPIWGFEDISQILDQILDVGESCLNFGLHSGNLKLVVP